MIDDGGVTRLDAIMLTGDHLSDCQKKKKKNNF